MASPLLKTAPELTLLRKVRMKFLELTMRGDAATPLRQSELFSAGQFPGMASH
jgi:hypothetical protein